jgi:hypothetical protein
MKYTLSDKIIAYLTLISGLTISAVAVWYSVAGLVSIFAASAVSIIIMGVALEGSKLVATVWLKWNWKRAPRMIRAYLITAIAILMVITSMGIFGYLSKAHSDQSLVSGEVQSKIAIYDEKIKTAKDNIDANRKALRQMDEAVDQVMGRSSDEKGADKAVQLRRSQQKERARLQSEIAAEQKIIAAVSEERAPIAAEVRKVEAEVGPLKYIAKLIYSDDPDTNTLEKAVTWVIIVIVLVFDPLAVVLLLASQYSFQWFRQAREEETTEGDSPRGTTDVVDTEPPTVTPIQTPWPFMASDDALVKEANDKIAEIDREVDVDAVLASVDDIKEQEETKALVEWNKMIEEAEKAVEEEKDLDDNAIINSAHDSEKEAMRRWKEENPDSSLKQQRRMFDKGVIDKLPWEEYLKPEADYTDDEAAEEAAKWAMEQLEIKKKDSELDGERTGAPDQAVQGRIAGYHQNAEQNERTLWQRIQDAKK